MGTGRKRGGAAVAAGVFGPELSLFALDLIPGDGVACAKSRAERSRRAIDSDSCSDSNSSGKGGERRENRSVTFAGRRDSRGPEAGILFDQVPVGGALCLHDAGSEKAELVFDEGAVGFGPFVHGFLVAGDVDDSLEAGDEFVVEILLAQLAQRLLSGGVEAGEAREFFGDFGDGVVEIFGVGHTGITAAGVV